MSFFIFENYGEICPFFFFFFFAAVYFHEKSSESIDFGLFCSAVLSLNLAVFATLAEICVN